MYQVPAFRARRRRGGTWFARERTRYRLLDDDDAHGGREHRGVRQDVVPRQLRAGEALRAAEAGQVAAAERAAGELRLAERRLPQQAVLEAHVLEPRAVEVELLE